MKTIIDMANVAVTGMVLKDIPEHLPTLDSCPSCILTKAKCLPFKTGCTCATTPGHCKYGFVLMDSYLHASWVLPLRAKSDALAKFEIWATKTIKAVMFDNAKELVAGKMKEYCKWKGIRINSSVPYSPSSNGVAERLVGVATNGMRAMLRDSKGPLPCYPTMVLLRRSNEIRSKIHSQQCQPCQPHQQSTPHLRNTPQRALAIVTTRS